MIRVTGFDYVLMMLIVYIFFFKHPYHLNETFIIRNTRFATKFCIVPNSNFHSTFVKFHKKLYDTFKDNTKFTEDIVEYKQEFWNVLTQLLLSEHDLFKINDLGFTELNTNTMVLQSFLRNVFRDTSQMTYKEVKGKKLINNDQVRAFLQTYPTPPLNVDTISVNNLRLEFKKVILDDQVYGLNVLCNEFRNKFTEYSEIRKKIETLKQDNQDVKTEEDKLQSFSRTINKAMFNAWNNKDKSYWNMKKILNNIDTLNTLLNIDTSNIELDTIKESCLTPEDHIIRSNTPSPTKASGSNNYYLMFEKM